MVKPIAQEFGVEVEETLTGFKFIGEKIEKNKRKVKSSCLVLKKVMAI